MESVIFGDVEIDRCPQCHGIWCDKDEQDILKTINGAEKIDVGSTRMSTQMDAHKLDCPRCHARMAPFPMPEQPHILLEKCAVCAGVFFDAGEFAEFKTASLEKNMPEAFL
jgi:Zn-finger nucleic acid-binding protein